MFESVRRVARAIFVDDIRLQRDGRGVRVVLAPPGEGADTPAATVPRPGDVAAQRLQRICTQLDVVMGESPGIRRRLQELAYVEQLLGEMGLAVLERAPLAVLAKAQQQLEDQIVDWSPVGLADLRSLMAVAVKTRRAQGEKEVMPGAEPAGAPAAPPSDEEAALLAAYGAAGTAPPPDR
jgi:hypothetical protein